MSEVPDNTTDAAYTTPAVHEHRDHRLHRVLAWVGIVAGVVFIVAVIFFSGFALGRSSGHHGWNRGYHSQIGPGRDGSCPMMRNQMTGPGGMDPGDMRPGMMRPGPSTAPTSSPSPGPAPR